MVSFQTVADVYAFEALTAGGVVLAEDDDWKATPNYGVVQRRVRLGAREFVLQRKKHPYKQKKTYRVKLGSKKTAALDDVEGLAQAIEERFGIQCLLEYASNGASGSISITSPGE